MAHTTHTDALFLEHTDIMPGTVLEGEGLLSRPDVIDRLRSLGTKCVVVTGRASSRANGALPDTLASLTAAGVEYRVFDAVEENPSRATVLSCAEEMRDFAPDFLLGVGGGSPIDCCKAVGMALLGRYPVDTPGSTAVPTIVAIPTTAGTGTEVTQYAIVSEPEGKASIAAKVFPVLSLIDATYQCAMPLGITISTAVDALTHSVESLLCVKSDEASEECAWEGVRLFGLCLPELMEARRQGGLTPTMKTVAYRKALCYCSSLGGLAIARTGTSLPHGLGYKLTELYGARHGESTGFFHPHYLRLCRDMNSSSQDRVDRILTLVLQGTGVSLHDGPDMLDSFTSMMQALLPTPPALSQQDIQAMVALVPPSKLTQHPEPVGSKVVSDLYTSLV
ncbi:hypothetical protein KIPB_009957 [Kipferlia bialata]|uniref:Alcohol dehydrogenase iron-type/glycerol dehydrogenase GldA domain-containing protein n=1 Tax=Kipferlia bialata TaxID=797122 RepID=A0A9K3GM00_9EUKA|nr:hypothetical protein KIPB_009957 [Kipferlia bialata]|eukprot:g9957.t1